MLFPDMIPVPVCEYCASGDVAYDDTASVAVAIVTSRANDLVEYVCADHAALLFPASWRTLGAIDPAALSTTATYSVGNARYAPAFQFLPIGPVVKSDTYWCAKCGRGPVVGCDCTPTNWRR